MEMQIAYLKDSLKHKEEAIRELNSHITAVMPKVRRYEFLREQELMLMTSDGVKYLKGEDLDEYVKEQLTPKLDLKEAALNDMTRRFNNALAQSMRMTKEVIGGHEADGYTYTTHGRTTFFTPQDYTMEININGNDTGKES